MTEPTDQAPPTPAPTLASEARAALGKRNLVLIGLMGAGKSAIGRMTAQTLGIPFVDSDHEIERVSRMSITENPSGGANGALAVSSTTQSAPFSSQPPARADCKAASPRPFP